MVKKANAAVLTDAAIKKFTQHATRRRIRDLRTQALYLVVEKSGTKSFEMRFRRPDGRPAKIRLGKYDANSELTGDPVIGQPLTLAAARQLATKLLRERKLGHDVIAEHKAHQHRARAALATQAATNFAAVARRFIIEHAKPHLARWFETARLLGIESEALAPLRGGLAEQWAEKSINAIDAHDIWTALDNARHRGVPGTPPRRRGVNEHRARALFAALSRMFSWALGQRLITANPCTSVQPPAIATARERTLSNNEVRWFWLACAQQPEPFRTIFKLLLLTGARLNEVAGMRREELHEDDTWRLPGSRTKNKRPHIVPLPPTACELIAAVPALHAIIFSTTGTTPPSGWSRAKRRLDAAMLAVAHAERATAVRIAPWRLHDLRRTAITGMAELGIRPDVIELAVNHVSGHRGGIAGVYNRSELLPERKAALQRWAAHVTGLVAGTQAAVVDLQSRRA